MAANKVFNLNDVFIVSNIVELLKEIKARPGMYLGGTSIARLASFLGGCYYGTGKTTHLLVWIDDTLPSKFGLNGFIS
jgi:hypothetical protein